MSDESDDLVYFRVEFVDGENVRMGYNPADAEAVRADLDRATTIIGCPDCGDLAPVTGGVPAQMPPCPRCGEPLHGVTEVHEIDGGDGDE